VKISKIRRKCGNINNKMKIFCCQVEKKVWRVVCLSGSKERNVNAFRSWQNKTVGLGRFSLSLRNLVCYNLDYVLPYNECKISFNSCQGSKGCKYQSWMTLRRFLHRRNGSINFHWLISVLNRNVLCEIDNIAVPVWVGISGTLSKGKAS
jgi:hypothetical protein